MGLTKTLHPNALSIEADEQSYWMLGYYVQQFLRVPHIESFAAKGMVFGYFCAAVGTDPAVLPSILLPLFERNIHV